MVSFDSFGIAYATLQIAYLSLTVSTLICKIPFKAEKNKTCVSCIIFRILFLNLLT